MRMTDELDRLILATVGDDFVTMEFIVEKLCGTEARLDVGNLRGRLFDLLADKLVNAYLLHADPPYITPVQIDSDALLTCWFYITQRGRKCLANSARKHSQIQHKGAGSHDPSQYTSAVNF
jgi:hypothetical protein